MKSLFLACALLPACVAAVVAAPASAKSPPAAVVRNVPETFFGTVVDDPYRWLENTRASSVQAWMKAQGAYTATTLGRIPGRAALLHRLQAYDASVPVRVGQVAREPDGTLVYERRAAGDNQFKLVMQHGWTGLPRVLVDPDALARRTRQPHAINYFAVSPGARVLAYGLSRGGSEAAVLHFIDTASGRPIGAPIDRAELGGVAFAPDGGSVVFNRLQALPRGADPNDKYLDSAVWQLTLGDPVSRAVKVFGRGVPGAELKGAETPAVSFTADGRWALATVVNGTDNEVSIFLASAAEVQAGSPHWTRLFDASAGVTGTAYADNTLYLRSHHGASRGQVLALDLRRPDLASAAVVVPAGERVITAIAAAADALYIEARDGNVKRLFKRRHGDTVVSEVALPLAGSFELNGDEGGYGAADVRLPGLLLPLQGWTRAPQLLEVRADGQVVNTGLQPAGPNDARDDIVATEVQVTSHDGARVPMSILHRKGIALDGTNPTLLWGYASYGLTEEPYFSVTRLAWLDQGGVFAVANPRGSGVGGEDWYRGGFQASKPNSWKDFIACAEFLIRNGYASPKTLGIWGASAGGILVGRAMTERPDLFAAVVPSVGALDMVRGELTPNGLPNIPEFGSRVTEPGFRALLAMSTYHQIQDGARYPAVMFTHGVNDPRVEVWNSTKTAARLMAASRSGKPVLLRLDWQAGHGVGSTKAQQLQERADVFSFLLWQMGVAGFQPK